MNSVHEPGSRTMSIQKSNFGKILSQTGPKTGRVHQVHSLGQAARPAPRPRAPCAPAVPCARAPVLRMPASRALARLAHLRLPRHSPCKRRCRVARPALPAPACALCPPTPSPATACAQPCAQMGSSPFQFLHQQQIFFFHYISFFHFFQLFSVVGKITKIIIIIFFFPFSWTLK